MGGAGLPGLIFAVLLLLLIGGSLFLIFPWMRASRQRIERLVDPAVDTLEYEVPEGQDPAVVVAALTLEGLDAVGELRHGRRLVLLNITGDDGEVRSRARAVIAHEAPLNPEGDASPDTQVRFLDEDP